MGYEGLAENKQRLKKKTNREERGIQIKDSHNRRRYNDYRKKCKKTISINERYHKASLCIKQANG